MHSENLAGTPLYKVAENHGVDLKALARAFRQFGLSPRKFRETPRQKPKLRYREYISYLLRAEP